MGVSAWEEKHSDVIRAYIEASDMGLLGKGGGRRDSDNGNRKLKSHGRHGHITDGRIMESVDCGRDEPVCNLSVPLND